MFSPIYWILAFFFLFFNFLDYAEGFAKDPLPAFVHSLSIYNKVANKVDGSNDVIQKKDQLIEAEEVEEEEEEESEAQDDSRPEERTVYVIQFESDSETGSDETNSEGSMDSQSALDPWSIVWYIGSFGGLVAFFLIVSCSEWCCRRGARQLPPPCSQRPEHVIAARSNNVACETPPPPYHLFAPPPYDSVNYGEIIDKRSGEKLNIYVISVPVQAPPRMQQQQQQQQEPPVE